MKTFAIGGVHPQENKFSASSPTEVLPIPAKVFIPLSQSLGVPSKPLVKKGDEVKIGQLIATGEALISSNLHSPVSGKVEKVDDYIDASGYRRPAIFITVEGEEWMPEIDTSPDFIGEITLEGPAIIEKIKEMGIVGMGGATFPTHVKLMIPPGKKAEYLIINGVECEPYLTSDHRLMLEKPAEMITGIRLLMKALGVEKAIIGIENNKPDAIELLSKTAADYPGIEVVPLKVKYPQGGEKQLIAALTGREVPSGKLPIEVGCVVQNVGTAFAVYEAVQKNKPLIERIVTVTGSNISQPSNFLVRIGTPIITLLEKAGWNPEKAGKIINGGPMMGKALFSPEVPVVKGTSGILVLNRDEAYREKTEPCIRCAKCISVCPMGLQPYLLARVSEIGRFDIAENEYILDCIECGSCQYTCPSARPLLDHIRLGKYKVNQIIRSRKN
ncbi:MAG: H+/Na+-translocating ferredoxin:NAD+ oxidoreductase subunit [Bacteroidales bacterium]|nr:H+/Na+-translocating ferredoxin:NAD+ oxidoreductase subunit [Bacteroidales bacterium]MDN5328439.1 H+/Na+-translocating ferredoxin:NAD+ oxidoreductase subunit [Bacteroidales bacterium]